MRKDPPDTRLSENTDTFLEFWSFDGEKLNLDDLDEDNDEDGAVIAAV